MVREEAGREAAVAAWHRLMAGLPVAGQGQEQGRAAEPPQPEEPAVSERTAADVVRAFLAERGPRVAPATARWYSDLLSPFAASAHGVLPAASVTAALCESYAARPGWSPSTRNGVLSALSVCFRWAGLPLAGLKKPRMQSRGRRAGVTDEGHATLMAAAPEHFRPVLELMHLTGARPGEVAAITAENFDPAAGVVRLERHKTEGETGADRLVFLPPAAVTLLLRQRERHPRGWLLRDRAGGRYTKDAVVGMMRRLRKKTGLHAVAYLYRHKFATDALQAGVPDATVAALLGHKGTRMVTDHYGHLTSRANAMRQAAAQVRGGPKPPT